MYSLMRAATVSGSPTSAVPAPPRTRPTPAHRLGLTSSLSRRPPCSAAMRCWPTESMRAKIFCAAAIVSSSTWRDQLVRGRPRLLVRLAHDDMQADAEAQLAALGRSPPRARARSSPRRRAGGSPQVRYLSTVSAATSMPAGGRAAEIERRPARLHRRKQQPAVLDARCACRVKLTVSPASSALIDVEELARHLVAFVVARKMPSPLFSTGSPPVTTLISSAAVGDAVEGRGHARRDASATEARPHGDEDIAAARVNGASAEATTQRILAATSRRQQHAEVAELVRRLRDLPQVVEIDRRARRCDVPR